MERRKREKEKKVNTKTKKKKRTHASACGRVPAVRNISATLGAPIVEAQSELEGEEEEEEEEDEEEAAERRGCGLQIPPGGPPPCRSDQSLPQRIHLEGSAQPSPQPAFSEEVPSRTWTRESCFFFFVVFFFEVVEVEREFIERASEMSDRERQQHKNSQSCSLTSLSERCLASSSVEGTPSAVVASEASHIKVRTPREPSAKPRRVRATSAGKDCADVAAARADELLILRPLFDALPSPPPAAAAPLGAEEEEGPAGEKSLLCAAARRTGERGEDGIVDEESSTTKDEEEERGERKKSAASSSSSSSSSSAAAAAFTFFLRTDSKILFFFFAGRRREGGT